MRELYLDYNDVTRYTRLLRVGCHLQWRVISPYPSCSLAVLVKLTPGLDVLSLVSCPLTDAADALKLSALAQLSNLHLAETPLADDHEYACISCMLVASQFIYCKVRAATVCVSAAAAGTRRSFIGGADGVAARTRCCGRRC